MADLTASELRQFTGTEQYYRNPLYRWMRYTDGVKYLVNKAEAYWLLDIIGTELLEHTHNEPFILLKLYVKPDHTAVLECDDGNECPPFYTRAIPYTDFPQGTWKLYLIDNVLLLPSEY